MGHHQPDRPGQQRDHSQAVLSLEVVHSRPEVGHDLKRPALAGTIQCQHWCLALPVAFVVMTRLPGLRDGFARGRGVMNPFRTQARQSITPIPTRTFIGDPLAFLLPATSW